MARIVADAVRVRVPATSANLGPGFDAFGLALSLHDVVEVRATTRATTTWIDGEGAGTVPGGEDHLVVKAIRAGLEIAGAPQVGLELRAVNAIPHGRGLGSSAAAVVAGLMVARGLISEPEALADDLLVALASEWEGHPDNAAACVLGGATVAWTQPDGAVAAERVPVSDALRGIVLVPSGELATKVARRVLPSQVPHADAAFTGARTALLVLALGGRPDLLLPATEDRIHQPYRHAVMPASVDLVGRLRAQGLPAVVSGAGPSVLLLGDAPATLLEHLERDGWSPRAVEVDHDGALLVP